MSTMLSQGLLITLVGMGLVFFALILMWWLMDILVRLFRERKMEVVSEGEPEGTTRQLPEEQELRRQAAAAAVALALHLRHRPQSAVVTYPPFSTTPWQIADRLAWAQQSRWIGLRKPQGGAK